MKSRYCPECVLIGKKLRGKALWTVPGKRKKHGGRQSIQRLEEERRLLKSYIKNNLREFAALPEIEPQVRDIILLWLSKALENKDFRGKTEDGQVYFIELPHTKERCMVRASDGVLEMPAYTIRFE